MADIGEVCRISTDLLRPYENNAKKHSPAQIRKIADSIKEFGFLNPVLIDKDYNVIAGHGRIMAMKELGETEVPCLFVEGLTEAQRRAYILADNRLTELVDFYMERGIKFFLFSPGLLSFNYLKKPGVCSFPVGAQIIYENGAIVVTGFLTNLLKMVPSLTTTRSCTKH